MRSLFLSFFAWCLCLNFVCPSLFASVTTQETIEKQRTTFLLAEKALKKKDYTTFSALSEKLAAYPLAPYLEYALLKQNIYGIPQSLTLLKLEAFEKKYPDFPYLTQLRNEWLQELAKQKKWAQFIKVYKKTKDINVECLFYTAQAQLNPKKALPEKVKTLWLNQHEPSPACQTLFHLWETQGGLSTALIWEKVQLAFSEKKIGLAKKWAQHLPRQAQKTVHAWEKLLKKPELLLQPSFSVPAPTPALRAIIFTQGILALTQKEPEKALSWWKKNHMKQAFSSTQIHTIERTIGIQLAHKKSPLAKDFLARLPKESLDKAGYEWRVRLALAQANWPEVLKWIQAMPEALQNENGWQYWRARALAQLKKKAEAETIYKSLAEDRHYYGFLASMQLNASPQLKNKAIQVPPSTLSQVANLPAIVRFEELLKVKRNAQARIEWFRAIDRMNDMQVRAAAKIAQKMKLYDIAILTIARTQHLDDLHLRFPLAHHYTILHHARKCQLDPAWVYAVTRQESAFFNEAVSPAGARGLMQVLPSTALSLAKQHTIPYHGESSLHHPTTNIQIGVLYLKHLKQKMHNHPVIAMASYNAGPTRTAKWLPQQNMEAAVWIETIPYRETREYIKNVIAFTEIYGNQLHTPWILSRMLIPIPGTLHIKH